MTFVVFGVLAGIPDQGNMKVFNGARHPDLLKATTMRYAKLLCLKLDISIKEAEKHFGVDELDLEHFQRGVGTREDTVFVYEVDVE
tara:strand:- start:145 stop:402 length:258 start_codon:yes stop_codon:yes gene_type:complete